MELFLKGIMFVLTEVGKLTFSFFFESLATLTNVPVGLSRVGRSMNSTFPPMMPFTKYQKDLTGIFRNNSIYRKMY